MLAIFLCSNSAAVVSLQSIKRTPILNEEAYEVYEARSSDCPVKHLIIRSKQPARQIVKEIEFQRIIGAARAILTMDCPAMHTIYFVIADSEPLELGVSRKRDQWELVAEYSAYSAAERIKNAEIDVDGLRHVVEEIALAREKLGKIPGLLTVATSNFSSGDLRPIFSEIRQRVYKLEEQDGIEAFKQYYEMYADNQTLPDSLTEEMREGLKQLETQYHEHVVSKASERLSSLGADFVDIPRVLQRGRQAVDRLRSWQFSEEHQKRVADAYRTRASALASAGLSRYERQINKLPSIKDSREALLEDVDAFKSIENEVPTIDGYIEAASNRIERIDIELCDRRLDALDVPKGAHKARLVAPRREVIQLRELLCVLPNTAVTSLDIEVQSISSGPVDRALKWIRLRDRQVVPTRIRFEYPSTVEYTGVMDLRFSSSPAEPSTIVTASFGGQPLISHEAVFTEVLSRFSRSSSIIDLAPNEHSLCDIAAADPRDPMKVLPGTARADLNGPAGVVFCLEELQENKSGRVLYQLSRSYLAAGKVRDAEAALSQAVAAGYPIAQAEAAFTILEDPESAGVEGLEKAVELLINAADAGVPNAAEILAEVESILAGLRPEYTDEIFNQPEVVRRLAQSDFGSLDSATIYRVEFYFYTMVRAIGEICPQAFNARKRQQVMVRHTEITTGVNVNRLSAEDLLKATGNIVQEMFEDPLGVGARAIESDILTEQAVEDIVTLTRFYGCGNPRLAEFFDSGVSVYRFIND